MNLPKPVRKASSTISIGLALGGITGPAAIATSALSVVASGVALIADVVSAVVGIVNYFDENDIIGTVHIDGEADYSCASEAEALNTYPSEMPFDPIVSGSGSEYKLGYNVCYSPEIDIYQRNWEVIIDVNSATFSHSGILGSGHHEI